jgi:tripartite-type tricarboxylate transporter receptor subunit TctC
MENGAQTLVQGSIGGKAGPALAASGSPMSLDRRLFLRLAGVVAAAAPMGSRGAWAQAYPARPVRVVVPYAPGGPTDVFGRLIAQRLSEQLRKQFYVENVSGANGNIGMGRAAKAAPDGYTMLIVSPSYAINFMLYDKPGYDPNKDFDPVALAASNPLVLTVHPSVPAKSVTELIAVVKANPGTFSYATGGTGSLPHLVGEQFRLSFRLDLVHVPFNSAGLAIGSVVAGHTRMSFGSLAPAVPQIEDGKLRALAVTGKARWPTLANVPTMTEAGYPAVEGENWQAVLVPAGTPGDIITLLNREIVKVITLPDMKERLAALGFEPRAGTPDDSAAQIKTEVAKWATVIRQAGIKAE